MAGESRSTTIIGVELIGQRNDGGAGVGGSRALAGVGVDCGNSCRASCNMAARLGPARNPKERMRTKPRGSVCSSNQKLSGDGEPEAALGLASRSGRLSLEHRVNRRLGAFLAIGS